MDPNATLEEALALAKRLLRRCEANEPADLTDLEGLSQRVLDLDEWLSRGGFLPKRWKDGER